MSPELKTVISFCLDKALETPPAQRALLYRGLAEICTIPQLAANFRATADSLESAERLSRQLAFDFHNPKATR